MEILFIQLSDNVWISISKKIDPYDWFCGPGSCDTEDTFLNVACLLDAYGWFVCF